MSLKSLARVFWAPGALSFLLLAGCATTPPRKLGVEVKNFDTSVRPQDDFYQYVNGTWVKTTQIPADRPRYGAIIELVDKSEAARSNDFGYARGSYSTTRGAATAGWFMRAWHREAGAWRIAMDVTNPAPPPPRPVQ